MPSVNKEPEKLRPYLFHKLDGEVQGDEWLGNCPFCGGTKLFINIEKGVYDCKTCPREDENGKKLGQGNIYTFMRRLYEISTVSDEDLESMAEERGVKVPTLRRWGATKSAIDGEWMFPTYGDNKEINNLYRWVPIKQKDGTYKRRLLPTATIDHGLFGIQFWDEKKGEAAVCEGLFDAMRLEEEFACYGYEGENLIECEEKDSLLSTVNIVAVPGTDTFRDGWIPKFRNVKTTLYYDNDHPRRICEKCKRGYSITASDRCPKCQGITGRYVSSAGFTGMRSAARKLRTVTTALRFLEWGEGGYDASLKDGWDVRDQLSNENGLGELMSRLEICPPDWFDGIEVQSDTPAIQIIECKDYAKLVELWSQVVHWTGGMEVAFSSMLGVVASTQQIGAQLWLRVMGEAGSTKSTLCEGLTACTQYVEEMGMQTGLHSGQSGKNLWDDINGKTVVINEGDMLVNSPNLHSTLAQMRDSWGGTVTAQYRNGVKYKKKGQRTTWIIAGTATLRMLNKSVAGDRFLDVKIFERPKGVISAGEMKMLETAVEMELNAVNYESNGSVETQDDSAKMLAIQHTAGFVKYLREEGIKKMDQVTVNEQARKDFIVLARLISKMRYRPHSHNEEEDESGYEVATRLARQITRLTKCLCIVLNKQIDSDIMRRIAIITRDTCHGMTFKVAQALLGQAMDRRALSVKTGLSEHKVGKALSILSDIDCVQPDISNGQNRARWRLTNETVGLLTRLKVLVHPKQILEAAE